MIYILFLLAGFIGSVINYRIINRIYKNKNINKKNEAAIISLFLPNVIFWTSNLGKDSIIYCGLMIMLYVITRENKNIKVILIAALGSILVFMVRPHVFMFLIISYIVGILFESKKLTREKTIAGVMILIVFMSLQKRVFDYLGFDKTTGFDSSQEVINEGMNIIEKRSESLETGGAGMEREKISLVATPIYALQFMFGPFIWQGRKPIQLISAIESIIYQLMMIYILVKIKNCNCYERYPNKDWNGNIYTYVNNTNGGNVYKLWYYSSTEKCGNARFYADICICKSCEQKYSS